MASSSSSSPEILGATSEGHFSYKHATHDEVLEDLSSRFILNLPDDELSSLERICFQVEQAHWFYEDFIREENPKLPSLPLKKFSAMLFHACPLLHQWSHDHEQAFNTFMQYKTRVPVCGAIMLNDTWEKCLLVKGWKSSSGWGFPKGKINEVEPPTSCAVREVLEETGYNLAGQINPDDVIEMTIKEQKISLFIVPGVPEDFAFKTKTRKEISKIEWFKLTDLPTWKRNKSPAGRFYLISPFIGPLKSFINERKPRNTSRKSPKTKKQLTTQPRKQQSFENHHSGRHESSSQSSSAENGDPQTPSPHYTEAHTNPVPQIANADPSPSGIPMDPHFAQLLSALVISASSSTTPAHPTDNGPAQPPKPSSRGSEMPVTILPSSLDSKITAHNTREQSASPQTSRIPVRESNPMAAYTHTSIIDDRGLNASRPLEPRSPTSIGFSQGRPTASTTSSRPIAASHRTSNNADISPYLSRPSTTVAPSTDRLKHIALLEAASAESARLMQAYKNAVAKGLPINVNDNFKQPVVTRSMPSPARVQSFPEKQPDVKPSLDSHTHDPIPRQTPGPVLYASRPTESISSIPMMHSNPSTWINGGPPSRSRTSLAYHHGSPSAHHPSSNMSLTSQITPFIHHGPGSSPQLFQNLSSQYASTVLPTPSGMNPSPLLQRSYPSQAHLYGPSLSYPAPLVQPPTHNPPGNTLLSILQGGRGPSRAAQTVPYAIIPNGASA